MKEAKKKTKGHEPPHPCRSGGGSRGNKEKGVWGVVSISLWKRLVSVALLVVVSMGIAVIGLEAPYSPPQHQQLSHRRNYVHQSIC